MNERRNKAEKRIIHRKCKQPMESTPYRDDQYAKCKHILKSSHGFWKNHDIVCDCEDKLQIMSRISSNHSDEVFSDLAIEDLNDP